METGLLGRASQGFVLGFWRMRGWGRQQELALWGASRYPSLCEKELEGSHMQGFGMAGE